MGYQYGELISLSRSSGKWEAVKNIGLGDFPLAYTLTEKGLFVFSHAEHLKPENRSRNEVFQIQNSSLLMQIEFNNGVIKVANEIDAPPIWVNSIIESDNIILMGVRGGLVKLDIRSKIFRYYRKQ